MIDEASFDPRENRSNWVRLRTLIVLRWFAILGQLVAITIAQRMFDLDLNLGLCFLAIGISIIANLVAMFVFPENKRLSEAEVAWMLLFDIAQLAFLLSLTGGLNNPFALLILAPVTISATALKPASTAFIGAATIAMVSVVTIWHIPLQTRQGFVMQMPPDFVLGFWTAIVIGVIFLGLYASRVTAEVHAMSDALAATQMALSREQKLTDIGGVVAAAAHELGTPLATIKLASAELIEELADHPNLMEDATLIRQQTDRCRDILRSMGQAGKDDLLTRRAPIGEVIREAAEPHESRGKTIHYDISEAEGADPRHPTIDRRPEVIHGIRNLVQNAVDFARENVWLDISWDATHISVRIVDDGPGFNAQVMGRIGDPFVRSRRPGTPRRRPGYEGMGLGLFIAKTLLERSGAEMSFANGREFFGSSGDVGQRSGAFVEAKWENADLGALAGGDREALGENVPFSG
ncbi:MAG: ActS/PrrB/RegB family redox-sensitive histidine kinase [Boseongicola sp.]|nr:MAG: ActS/PrrB/RegB family redox-sensitive histidine kinase [Boseongicola sp.]